MTGQLTMQIARLGRLQRGAEHLAIQGVPDAQTSHSACLRGGQEPTRLEIPSRVECAESGEQIKRGRLGEDDQRERATFVGAQ